MEVHGKFSSELGMRNEELLDEGKTLREEKQKVIHRINNSTKTSVIENENTTSCKVQIMVTEDWKREAEIKTKLSVA